MLFKNGLSTYSFMVQCGPHSRTGRVSVPASPAFGLFGIGNGNAPPSAIDFYSFHRSFQSLGQFLVGHDAQQLDFILGPRALGGDGTISG